MRNKYQITEYCHHFIEEYIQNGDLCVDATAGNGNDTEFLCRAVGEEGKVYAFDIQEEALEHTRERLEMAKLSQRAELILAGHEHMSEYVKGSASVIMFNFGYLPGGDHRISTTVKTSICAIEQSLQLLKKGGILSLCIYSGKETGYEEKDAIMQYIKNLSSKQYLVLVHEFFNRRNDPPLPVFIVKLSEV